MLVEEKELNPPLYFKRISIEITTSNEGIIYPPIPKDWYRGAIEQPHISKID